MPEFLTYGFAAVTLIFGALVILLRNPVPAALSLVMSFVGAAGLFLSLDAYFIAVIQILVYAGAVMVLFLFIIMLLDLKHEKSEVSPLRFLVIGAGVFIIFALALSTALWSFKEGSKEAPPLSPKTAAQHVDPGMKGVKAELESGKLPDAQLVGLKLFTKYPFQLQLTGLLLVAATVGVVLLSRREPKS